MQSSELLRKQGAGSREQGEKAGLAWIAGLAGFVKTIGNKQKAKAEAKENNKQ